MLATLLASSLFLAPNEPGFQDRVKPALACPLFRTIPVDFRGDHRPYPVEWRRCGPPEARWGEEGKPIQYPQDFLLVRSAEASHPVLLAWGVTEVGADFLQRAEPTELAGKGGQQLLVVVEAYGTGHYLEWEVLGYQGKALAPWEAPDIGEAMAATKQRDEDFCCKGYALDTTAGRIVLEQPVYHHPASGEGDPNCCPTRGWVRMELLPEKGRFVLGPVTRKR